MHLLPRLPTAADQGMLPASSRRLACVLAVATGLLAMAPRDFEPIQPCLVFQSPCLRTNGQVIVPCPVLCFFLFLCPLQFIKGQKGLEERSDPRITTFSQKNPQEKSIMADI